MKFATFAAVSASHALLSPRPSGDAGAHPESELPNALLQPRSLRGPGALPSTSQRGFRGFIFRP